MFAQELGIRPWEIGDLTMPQFRSAIANFEDLLEQSKER